MAAVDVAFDPFDPGFRDDPYPTWRTLREHDPVHETPFGAWFVLRYDDVLRLVRDPTLSADARNATPGILDEIERQALGDDYGREIGGRSMLNLDPPDHTRLRRLVSKAFTPRVIERLRPRIQQLVDDALDRVAPSGEIELIGDLAFPLPFAVISEMLGMPPSDEDRLRDWSGTLVRRLEPQVDTEVIRAIADADEQMTAFVTAAIARKRQSPADDLLSALIAAEESGDTLADDELVDQVMLLYIAGHETTVNLIGNGTLALLRHRDDLIRLRDDPSLDANAVDELLRYDPPVQMTRRIALTQLDIGGRTISPGTFVICVLASANRDPDRWGDDADDLDLGRADAHGHLAFGGGSHYCLGAALARLEAQITIGTLIRRFPGLDLAGEPVWNGRLNLRGLDHLNLALAA